MARDVTAPRAPTSAAVARIPTIALDHRLYRVQWVGRGPWWFSTRTGNASPGRFDLKDPYGTCYFADDPVAALIEKLVDPRQEESLVDARDLQRLRVWSGTPPAPWAMAADTTDRRSRMPKELGTTVPYDLPWQWADAVHNGGQGRPALRYWLRLDPGHGRGIAAFSTAGVPRDPPPLQDRRAVEYVDELRAVFDVVESPPTLDQLVPAADPVP